MYTISGYVLIMGFIRIALQNKLNSNKIFVIIASVSLFLIASFRSIYFGTDVIGYTNRYLSLSYQKISYFWSNFINGEGKDPFFYLFSKLISISGVNHHIWLTILSGIFVYSVSKLIYKYSEESYISFIALISLGYFFFSLTGLRQALALSILLLSYSSLRERKLLTFVLLVLLASLFHSSALIFIIAYPLINMKMGLKHFVGIASVMVLATFFSGQIREIITIISWSDNLSEYANSETSLSISGFLIQLSIFLFCLIFKKGVLNSDIRNLSLYNLLFLGLLFQAFSTVIAEFFRISMYFSIFSIVLIPKAINTIQNKNLKIIVYLSVLSALIVYVYWTGTFSQYKFFWQEV